MEILSKEEQDCAINCKTDKFIWVNEFIRIVLGDNVAGAFYILENIERRKWPYKKDAYYFDVKDWIGSSTRKAIEFYKGGCKDVPGLTDLDKKLKSNHPNMGIIKNHLFQKEFPSLNCTHEEIVKMFENNRAKLMPKMDYVRNTLYPEWEKKYNFEQEHWHGVDIPYGEIMDWIKDSENLANDWFQNQENPDEIPGYVDLGESELEEKNMIAVQDALFKKHFPSLECTRLEAIQKLQDFLDEHRGSKRVKVQDYNY